MGAFPIELQKFRSKKIRGFRAQNGDVFMQIIDGQHDEDFYRQNSSWKAVKVRNLDWMSVSSP